MIETSKPLPLPDLDTRGFWDACALHELRAQRCANCRRFHWPPQEFCPHCYTWEQEWTILPGTGVVKSFSVVHHSTSPAFKAEVPYVVAVIELDGTEGDVAITSNVIDVVWDSVEVGMPVEVVFQDLTPEATLPLFRPHDGSPSKRDSPG